MYARAQNGICFACSLAFALLLARVCTAGPEPAVGPRAALYVHGSSLAIHPHGSVSAFGDVLLDSATVLGSGSLMLSATQHQSLWACHSQVNNLTLRHPKQVKTIGQLRVLGSRQHRQAAPPDSTRTLASSSPAAKKIADKPTYIPKNPRPGLRPSHSQVDFALEGASSGSSSPAKPHPYAAFTPLTNHYHPPPLRPGFMPPEPSLSD